MNANLFNISSTELGNLCRSWIRIYTTFEQKHIQCNCKIWQTNGYERLNQVFILENLKCLTFFSVWNGAITATNFIPNSSLWFVDIVSSHYAISGLVIYNLVQIMIAKVRQILYDIINTRKSSNECYLTMLNTVLLGKKNGRQVDGQGSTLHLPRQCNDSLLFLHE
jgi:hypothetical protein